MCFDLSLFVFTFAFHVTRQRERVGDLILCRRDAQCLRVCVENLTLVKALGSLRGLECARPRLGAKRMDEGRSDIDLCICYACVCVCEKQQGRLEKQDAVAAVPASPATLLPRCLSLPCVHAVFVLSKSKRNKNKFS